MLHLRLVYSYSNLMGPEYISPGVNEELNSALEISTGEQDTNWLSILSKKYLSGILHITYIQCTYVEALPIFI